MWTAAQKKTRCKVWYKVKTKHIPLCQVLSWSKCTPHCKAGEPWRTVWKTSNGLRSTPRGTFLWKRRWTERCEPCFPRKFLYNPSYKISKKLHFHETPWNIVYPIAIKFRYPEISWNPDYAVIESTRASFSLTSMPAFQQVDLSRKNFPFFRSTRATKTCHGKLASKDDACYDWEYFVFVLQASGDMVILKAFASDGSSDPVYSRLSLLSLSQLSALQQFIFIIIIIIIVMMVIGLSGVRFGLQSNEWLRNRMATKREFDLRLITRMITDGIGLHSAPLPINPFTPKSDQS